MLLKSALLFERGVVTTSVPTRVFDPDEPEAAEVADLL
jgi:hypothetical protein